uniref:Tyrosine-protein kinase ephrin type A/B receptor-like domain-containing protein n=1 Tax=Eptatretus burgeri TaxID=7764 RepID=A0A8C4QE55_EPTBU
MKIVYQTIRWYFAMQKPSASMDPPVMLPVFYVRHSLWTLRLERCRPGFGKDQEKICPRCCVACTPGTFSSTQSTLCQVCALGFYNPYFGAISCEVCPAWKTTKHTGSQRLQDCYVEPNFINLGIAASGSLSVFLIIIAIIALRMRSCSKPVEAEMMKRHKPNMIKKAQEFEKAIDSINLTEERKKLQPCSTGTLFDSRSSISDVETIVTENSLAVSSTSWGSAGSSTEDDAVATAHTSFSMDPVE